MNKKGFVDKFMVVVYLAIALAVIIALSYFGGILFPIISQQSSVLSSSIVSQVARTGDSALINATQASIVPANQAIQTTEWISYSMIIMLFLSLIIMCFFVRTYPFLAFIWIFLILILVFISIFLAHSYETTIATGALSSAYSSWENTNYILLYMPHIITAIGFIGGIILFLVGTRDNESEGSTVL